MTQAADQDENEPAATFKFDKERAQMLYNEIGKVRCWLTGYAAARNGNEGDGIPGSQSLRMTQLFLKDLIQNAD